MAEIFDLVSFVFELGGPVVVILIVASIIALTLIFYKIGQFVLFEVGKDKLAKKAMIMLHSGHQHDALSLIKSRRGLVAKVAELIIKSSTSGKATETIEDAVETLATERLHQLQSGLKALDTISQIAPLLGLFGTVLGMIDAFKALQGAGSSVDPSILAGGIWVALLTTAVGLGVAMPISVVLSYFETRLEKERVSVEVLVGEAFNPILREN